MKFLFSLALTAMLAGGLAGCGGGGGGSDSGGGGGGSGSGSNNVAVAAGVVINGAAAPSDASGAYVVNPGDKVEIAPSQASDWSTSSDVAGAISLRNANISATKWSAQFTNSATGPVSYTVSWKAAGSAAGNTGASKDAQSVVLKIAAGDVRNGTYKMFEPNGTQPTLVLDFNVMAYDMTDAAGGAHSGAFSADASEPGTYVFASSRITSAVNTARFRVTTDAVVGGFPFETALSNPVSYAVEPFVAARSFVTTPAPLDGNYNMFAVYRGNNGLDSTIGSIQIVNGGTRLVICNDNGVYAITACPVPSRVIYTIAQGATPDRWEATNDANPDPAQRVIFHMARIGGKNVLLRASFSLTTGTKIMRVALQDSADWPSVTAHGIATGGTWGAVTLNTSAYVRTRLAQDGTTSTLNFPVAVFGGPLGMRILDGTGADAYFAAQSGKLIAVVGARGNPNTAGNLTLALTDD